MNKIQQLFKETKCGKTGHLYHELYWKDLQDKSDLDLLEVGVLRGESINTWIKTGIFKSITGIDTFGRVPYGDVAPMFEEYDNVTLIKSDSINKDLNLEAYDVIIDDGFHSPVVNADTFANLFPYLRSGGIYYIEDVFPFHRMTEYQKKNHWFVKYQKERYQKKHYNYFNKIIDSFKPMIKSITEHDWRPRSRKPDSFIYRIVKN
jgi:hypothetical protein